MIKSDSPKEEGEISDEDDVFVKRNTFRRNSFRRNSFRRNDGDSLILPVIESAHNMSCRVSKVKNNKRQPYRRRKNNNKKKKFVPYNKEQCQSAKVPDNDYYMMIREYKNIRRKLDETVEGSHDVKSTEHEQICELTAEDDELLQLRLTALRSAEERLDSRIHLDDQQQVVSTSQTGPIGEYGDNYDVVQMDVESDAEGQSNIGTGSGIRANESSYNINVLQEHIQNLMQKKNVITECQRQLERRQSILSSEMSPAMNCGLPISPLLTQHQRQPLLDIIHHNLNSTASVLPFDFHYYPVPHVASRPPLLSEPTQRAPLLPNPGLLPTPSMPPLPPYSQFGICQPPILPKPLMSLSLGDIPSNDHSNDCAQKQKNRQRISRWSDNDGYSPKPIEVIGASGRGESHKPLLSNPASISSDLQSTSIAGFSRSSIGGSNSDVSQTSRRTTSGTKDTLYEDFEDELNESKKSQNINNPSMLVDEVTTSVKSPSPSWLLSLPQYEGPSDRDNAALHDVDLRKTRVKTKPSVAEEVVDCGNNNGGDDYDCYLSHLKNKLLMDIKFRKTEKATVMDFEKDSSKSKNIESLGSNEKYASKLGHLGRLEEEEATDMIVIDSDHEASSPVKIIAGFYQNSSTNDDGKPDISSEVSEFVEGSSNGNIRDEDGKDEEMILRERLLRSLASRQSKLSTEQSESDAFFGQSKMNDENSTISREHERSAVTSADRLQPWFTSQGNARCYRELMKKKRKNRKNRERRNKMMTLVVPRSSVPLLTTSLLKTPTSSSASSFAVPSSRIVSPKQSPQVTITNMTPSTSQTMPPAKPRHFNQQMSCKVIDVPSTSAIERRPATIEVKPEESAKQVSNSKEVITATNSSNPVKTRIPFLAPSRRVVHSITTKYTKFPNCEPIVIYLSGDETEEEEEEEPHGAVDNLSNRLESLLKEARREVPKLITGGLPPDVVQPTSIAMGTRADGQPLTSVENKKISTSSNNISTDNTITNNNNKKKSLEHPLKKDKLENLSKEELMRREKELEVSLLNHKLKQLQDKSDTESKSLREEKVRLLKLESILSKRRAELVTTEANAQKIKEQLEAVLKILNHNQLQVADFDKKREAMRSQILEKERKTLRTSNDITECQEKLLRVTKSLGSKVSDTTTMYRRLKNKRKHDDDNDIPQAKRSMGAVKTINQTPATSNSTTTVGALQTGGEISFVGAVEAGMTTEVNKSDGSSKSTIADKNKINVSAQKNVLKSKASTSLVSKVTSRKSKTETQKVQPAPTRDSLDEKYLKIKDLHRKSTMRNTQPVQTTTTCIVPPAFDRPEKLLAFKPAFLQQAADGSKESKHRTSPEETVNFEEHGIPDLSDVGRQNAPLKSIMAYRTENEFSDLMFTHKLETDVPLCKFELFGKCNDDGCPWQHERDISMSTKEVLMEIVSYHPYIVPDIDDKTPLSKYKALVGAYVDEFMTRSTQNDSKKMYLMMLHLVSQAKGSAIFTPLNRDRLWSVKQDRNDMKKRETSNDDFVLDVCLRHDDDDALSSVDRRYWMTNDARKSAKECHYGDDDDYQQHNYANLSEATFLKKALSMLDAEAKSKNPKLDTALKILAKGIEHHPNSPILWHQYLKVFTQKRNQEVRKNYSVHPTTSLSSSPPTSSSQPQSSSQSRTASTSSQSRTTSSSSQPSALSSSPSKGIAKSDGDSNVRIASDQLRVAYLNALEMVPSYDLHWQFIQTSELFTDKMESCSLALQFICSDQVGSADNQVRSHWLLEVILYQAQICFHTGKNSMGMDIIEDCLNSQDAYGVLSRMIASDRLLLWMSFLHLSIFHSLPSSSLFSRNNDNAGMIVCKTPFSIYNHHLSLTAKQAGTNNDNYKEILAWYDKGITECLKYFFDSPSLEGLVAACGDVPQASLSLPIIKPEIDEGAWSWLGRLFISKANLLVEFERYNECFSFLTNVASNPSFHLPDIKIYFMHLLDHDVVVAPGFHGDHRQVFASIIEYTQGCLSAKLTYHVAKQLVSKDQSEEALQLLERLPIRIHNSNSGKEDPNILYCKLLDLELPMDFIPPSYSTEFKKEFLEKERVYFWLCYCLLLDLQGDYDSAEDIYNKAACRQKCASDLGEICLVRLDRLFASLGQSPSCEVLSEFFKFVDKSLISLPVKLLLPSSEIGGKTYDSYDVHNSIVGFCVRRIKSPESLTSFYNWLLSTMPGNSQLAVEAMNHLMRNNCRSLARGFIIIALQESPGSLALWKTSLKLAFLEGNTEQMRADYKKSLENLPYQKKLWKDLMLFEMMNKRDQGMIEKSIVGRGQELGINILDLFRSLSTR